MSSPSPLWSHRRCALLGLLSALPFEKGMKPCVCWVDRCSKTAELSPLACRRITNRESARRMRLKRQEEWAAIKRQVRSHSLHIGLCTLPTLKIFLSLPVTAERKRHAERRVILPG